jgi:Ras-related protein Rab-5C
MTDDINNISLKCVLLGESCVGKSSISRMFVSNIFDKYSEPTIGAVYTSKIIELSKGNVRLNIWDTAGQEKYDSLVPMYYRGANIVLIVYDITSKLSYEKAISWINIMKKNGPLDAIYALIGNKNDLKNRNIDKLKGEKEAMKHEIKFYETNAKDYDSIYNIFKEMAEEAYLVECQKERYEKLIFNNNKKTKKCFFF